MTCSRNVVACLPWKWPVLRRRLIELFLSKRSNVASKGGEFFPSAIPCNMLEPSGVPRDLI
ncbi:hypothetical protein L209DRAFT_313295 [Thermothelomyces heterothallicus CBS 203.75]